MCNNVKLIQSDSIKKTRNSYFAFFKNSFLDSVFNKKKFVQYKFVIKNTKGVNHIYILI